MGGTPPWLALGKVVGAHGVRGAVRVHFFSGAAPEMGPGARIGLRRPGGEIEAVALVEIAPHQRQFRLWFEGVADREAAEALVGAELMVPRDALPDLEDGTYYWADLIGLDVRTVDDRPLGRLVHILETGSNDVYVVQREGGEVLVPALATVVRRIDLAAGRMWVALPEGL